MLIASSCPLMTMMQTRYCATSARCSPTLIRLQIGREEGPERRRSWRCGESAGGREEELYCSLFEGRESNAERHFTGQRVRHQKVRLSCALNVSIRVCNTVKRNVHLSMARRGLVSDSILGALFVSWALSVFVHSFTNSIDVRRIHSEKDLARFLRSKCFLELWSFVLMCNNAVKNKPNSAAVSPQEAAPSPSVQSFLDVLEDLGRWIDEIPPIAQPTRFGNKAFRSWHVRLEQQAPDLMRQALPAQLVDRADELATYLTTSFGNETRIDYGSGHEATFLVLLYCCYKLGAFVEKDLLFIVLCIYRRYLDVTRKLQTVYKLEPAGSHGVWGLDDYSFVNFLWGASQLYDNKLISPPSVINDNAVIDAQCNEYLYVDAIRFIKRVKTGPFFEHSPMLRDISEVREGWPKINSGLIKMYRAEVWGKRPVVQHLLFGTVFWWPEDDSMVVAGSNT